MYVSSELQAPAALSTGKEPRYPLKYGTLLIGTWLILSNAVIFFFHTLFTNPSPTILKLL